MSGPDREGLKAAKRSWGNAVSFGADPEDAVAAAITAYLSATKESAQGVVTDAMVEAAVKAGWNACRKNIYAVCEDIRDEADRLRALPAAGIASVEQYAKGYHAGTCYAAKSIARGFNSMEAEDDDNFRAALEAALAPAASAEGMVMAPAVPTTEMEAACRNVDMPHPDIYGDFSDDQKERAGYDIYRAMIAARPKGGSDA